MPAPVALHRRLALACRAAWLAGLAAWRAAGLAAIAPAAGPAPLPAAAPRDDEADAQGLATLLAHSPDIVVHLDAGGRIVGRNDQAAARLPAGPGPALRRLAAPGEWRRWHRELRPALERRGVWVGETTLRVGGRCAPFTLTVLPRRDAAGGLCGYTAVLRDLSADHAAHHQIKRQNEILSVITEALPATVVIVDAQGRYRYVNSAFEKYAGRAAADILGRTAGEVLGADEVARRRPFMKRAFAGEAVDFVLDYPTPEGTSWLALSCIPIRLDGVFDGFVGIGQDITAQRREQARLSELAERDPLTGLLNRAGLEQRVAAQRALCDCDEMALLYIDLDHFKAVNDTLGHGAGDELLRRFSRRLQRTVRASDAVARLGGDEFAILLAGVCDLEVAHLVGDKVLAAARRPFELEGQAQTVGASVGLAVLPRERATLPELLRQADLRLYRAKAAGRGRVCGDADAGEAIAPAVAAVD